MPKPVTAASLSARDAVAEHQGGQPEPLFGITALCREFGVSLRTLRFYEDKGLLSPRRVNGARVYTRRDRARLVLILRAKGIGLSLDEIRHTLDLYGSHGEGRVRQMRYVVERTGALMAELERKRSAIDATLAELRVIHDATQRELAGRG